MKHQDEFRNGKTARALADRLKNLSTKPVRLMEICGTHTVSIFRHGLKQVFPKTVSMISGPGCPVCVTATEEIDRALVLARNKNVKLAAYGDLIRVPGSDSSLKEEMAQGADVSIVYSSMDALRLAEQNPDREVVFLGIGFETTAPTAAAAVLAARKMDLYNFSILSGHKLLPPAMEALLSSDNLNIDGFLCPGHVTTIIGTSSYKKISDRYCKPCVVAGFESVDIMQGVLMLVKLLEKGRAETQIQYKRGAAPEGNPKARQVMDQVFIPEDAPWRGLGVIPLSGLAVRPELERFDARKKFDLEVPPAKTPKGCRCGDVLRGSIVPPDCPLFKKNCTPQKPVGPCMVSSEGACAAWYQYNKVD